MSAPAIPITDAITAANQTFKQGYAYGREAGLAEAQVRIECLELLVDHWYFVANNPGSVEAERKEHLSFVELREIRSQREAQRAEWDAEEQMTFDLARTMIDEGRSDREVAVALGILITVVQSLRAGIL